MFFDKENQYKPIIYFKKLILCPSFNLNGILTYIISNYQGKYNL